MSFLLLNWRWISAAALTFLVCLFIHNWRVDALQAEWQTETAQKVEAAEAVIVKQCEADKAKSKKVQAGYEARIGVINTKLNELRGSAARCADVTGKSSAVPASGAEHAGDNGLTVEWLRTFAAKCEEYRAQRITDDEYLGR